MDTKLQKKYESDMTKKEKRALERQKLASMGMKAKIEYIIGYYKFHILGVILAVFAVIGLVKWADSLKNENMLYLAVVNSVGDGGTIMEDFKEYLGDTDKYHIFTIDNSVMLGSDNGTSQADYTSTMKLTTLVGAGTADVFICPEDIYKEYAQQDILVNISDLMGKEFVADNPDICEEYAIRVEDNKVLKKYGLTGKQPAYLITFAFSKHPDVAAQFVDFIMEE